MRIAYDKLWIGGLCIAATAVASLPSACFLDSSGVAPGGGGAGTGGTTTTSSATTSTTGNGMDAGPDVDAATCGDGVVEPGEQCDGTQLNGATCASAGYAGGTLACTADCRLDTSGCHGFPTDWYDPSWHHRRPIVIDHTKVAGDLSDFAVAVVVSDTGLLNQLQASAADVLLTAADGKTKLAHEIELFDKAASSLVIWVRVPLLSASTDTTLYLYYANPTCSSQANAAGVWDAHEQMVLHLGEPATTGGTTTTFADSTGHGHSGAQHGTADTQGQIGRAQVFDGVSQYIDVAGPDGVVIGAVGCTISAWVKTTAATSEGILAKAQGEMHVPADKILLINAAHQLGFDSANVASTHGQVTVNDGQWHHVAWTQTPGATAQWDLYVDGAHDGSWMYAAASDVPGYTLRIGSRVAAGTYDVGFFAGNIDEVRVADTPRSPVWIQTSFNNQGDPGAFYTVGAEQP